ncbi:hypothetical protein N8079_01720 [Crocinitomicaceae bacterium]|nr:hypothetical protein [Crocinitomicaceae bacterium]
MISIDRKATDSIGKNKKPENALDRNETCEDHSREESVELDGEQKGEAKRDE